MALDCITFVVRQPPLPPPPPLRAIDDDEIVDTGNGRGTFDVLAAVSNISSVVPGAVVIVICRVDTIFALMCVAQIFTLKLKKVEKTHFQYRKI